MDFRKKENELQSPTSKFFTEEETNAILDRMGAEVGDVFNVCFRRK